MDMNDNFTEKDMDKYFELEKKDNLTKEEQELKDYLILTAMLVRALGGKFTTKRADHKLRKIVFGQNADEIAHMDKEREENEESPKGA